MTREDQERLLDEAEALESGCTGWEIDFMESVREQFDAGRNLSTKQTNILERIVNGTTD